MPLGIELKMPPKSGFVFGEWGLLLGDFGGFGEPRGSWESDFDFSIFARFRGTSSADKRRFG